MKKIKFDAFVYKVQFRDWSGCWSINVLPYLRISEMDELVGNGLEFNIGWIFFNLYFGISR